MLEEFYDRINLKSNLSELSKQICERYNLGTYLMEEIILVGYEDFNFILTTDESKYCVKVFNKDRNIQDVMAYIDRIRIASTLKINTPKIYDCDKKLLCEINLDNVNYKLCVFQYIDGKSFYELDEIPTDSEIKNIVEQMACIHSAKLDSSFIYDKWTITNFIDEYKDKGKYLEEKYKKVFESLIRKFHDVDLEKLPKAFVHGDIISSNVMKDNDGKLWIIDFAVSNFLPRIVDLAVSSSNLCLYPDSVEKTVKSIGMLLTEYQKYNELTDYELDCFPLFFELANAMGILQISYLKSLGDTSIEDDFWLNESEKGLSFSNEEFWNQIFKKDKEVSVKK